MYWVLIRFYYVSLYFPWFSLTVYAWLKFGQVVESFARFVPAIELHRIRADLSALNRVVLGLCTEFWSVFERDLGWAALI